MAKDPLSQLSNVNAGLDQTIKKLNAFESILKRIGGIATKSLDSITRIMMPSVGMGPGLGLGTANAQFSNGAGGTPVADATNKMPWIYSKKGAAAIGGVQIGLGLMGGAYAALPDVGMTISRATGFFQSSLRTGGGMNRAGVAAATFSALGGGVTGLGEDAAANAVLAQGFNFMPGTSAMRLMERQVGGAARYFGMPNATAAMAIGGMHTGRMGAQLYQFGINTTDPNTGEPVAFEQIVSQLYNRMTMNGRLNPTAEEMAANLRGGFGRKDMEMFSAEQRALIEPMLINMAAGKPLGSLASLPFNPDNPQLGQMKIASSTTALMERGTEPMIAGFEKAATAVAAFNKSLEGLPDSIFQLKGAIQGVSGTNVGTGLGVAIGGIGLGLGGLLGARSLRMTAARAGAAAVAGGGAVTTAAGGATTAVAGATAAKFGIKAALRFVPYVGTALLAYEGVKFLGKNMFGTPANAAQTSQTGTNMTAGMDPQLIQTLQNAGFRGESLTTAYGIVKAESGGRANAYNPTGMDDSYGLFQINMENNDPRNPGMGNKRNEMYLKKYASIGYTGPESLKDPYINARIAYDISKGGTNFKPWTTYTSGKYLEHTSGVTSTNVGNKTVNITVSLANASTAEANRLAKQVKEILLKDKDLQEVGSK